MNREDIIKLAREAGWQYADDDRGYEPLWRFASLVAAAERDRMCKQFNIQEELAHEKAKSNETN